MATKKPTATKATKRDAAPGDAAKGDATKGDATNGKSWVVFERELRIAPNGHTIETYAASTTAQEVSAYVAGKAIAGGYARLAEAKEIPAEE